MVEEYNIKRIFFVLFDKDKVKVVNVGVDEDISSEGDKFSDQVFSFDFLIVNVQQYLIRSLIRFFFFVKLINICEG